MTCAIPLPASERIGGTIAAAMGEGDHRKPGAVVKLRG